MHDKRQTIISLSTWAIALVFSLALTCPLAAQDKPMKLFETGDTLKIKLHGPWRDIERKAEFQGNYPAKIEWTDELGNNNSLDIEVSRRGLTRQRVCRYPPIKLYFDKEQVKGTTFRGQKNLKMVTHCDKGSRFEQYYITEMLIYQIYNLITDYSFRVRPLEVVYIDQGGKEQPERFGFLIEDDSDVAARNDLKKLNIGEIEPEQMDPVQASNLSLFQYLVGNVDYAALSGPDPEECCHNAKLIGPEPLEDGDLVVVIPYDFDSAGLVNAHYAAPPANLKINSVTQRLYRGFCIHNDTLEPARERILSKEAEIMALFDNPLLTSGTQKKAVKFMEKGFFEIRDQKNFEKKIIENCRK